MTYSGNVSTQRGIQSGNANILIQVEGSHNSITVGSGFAPLLTLTPHRLCTFPIRKELDILNPHCEAIPYVRRPTERQMVDTWLLSPKPVSILPVAARGGAGKTRFALEILKGLSNLAPVQNQAWDGGMANHNELRALESTPGFVNVEWGAPTIMVLDYAASCTEALKVLARKLELRVRFHERAATALPPLRLLLLERHAHAESGWLEALVDRSKSTSTEDLFEDVLELAPLVAAEERRKILIDTMVAFAAFRPGVALPVLMAQAELDQILSNNQWHDPLGLMMAAATASTDGWESAFGLKRAGLAYRVAAWEAERIQKYGEKALLLHMAGLSTLCGGISSDRLLDLADREITLIKRPHPGGAAGLADQLRSALPTYPPTAGVGAIQPDIVAEAFVVKELQTRHGGIATLLRAVDDDTRSVEFLLRALVDFSEFKVWISGADPSNTVRTALEREFPDKVLELRKAFSLL